MGPVAATYIRCLNHKYVRIDTFASVQTSTQDLPNVALGLQRSLAIIAPDHMTDARHYKAELKMQRQITSDMISNLNSQLHIRIDSVLRVDSSRVTAKFMAG